MAAEVQDTTVAVSNDPAAHEALRAAHDGGYRFPDGFNGFSGKLSVIEANDQAVRRGAGAATVGGPRSTVVELDTEDDLATWARTEVASMAGHRWPTPYEQSDGRWTLTIEDNTAHPLGRLVTVHDDQFQSSYRVRDGRISQVTRTMRTTRFTITIQSHTSTDDHRLLPAEFTVTYWDTASQRLTRADAYTDRYASINGVWIPKSRRVVTATDAGFVTRELELTDVVLLDAPFAVSEEEVERHGTRAG